MEGVSTHGCAWGLGALGMEMERCTATGLGGLRVVVHDRDKGSAALVCYDGCGRRTSHGGSLDGLRRQHVGGEVLAVGLLEWAAGLPRGGCCRGDQRLMEKEGRLWRMSSTGV